jgi:hypothetical protein
MDGVPTVTVEMGGATMFEIAVPRSEMIELALLGTAMSKLPNPGKLKLKITDAGSELSEVAVVGTAVAGRAVPGMSAVLPSSVM